MLKIIVISLLLLSCNKDEVTPTTTTTTTTTQNDDCNDFCKCGTTTYEWQPDVNKFEFEYTIKNNCTNNTIVVKKNFYVQRGGNICLDKCW